MGIVEYIGSIGGITGVLAFLMFLIYRQDHKSSEANLAELARSATKEQAELLKAYNETCRQHTEAMVENTKVQTELITWLQRNNRHS
jgi:hypothetical protein